MDRKSHSARYKEAGVDITAGYDAVERMKKHVARTKIPGVLSSLGGFGGLFAPDLTGISTPVLVSGADGVGTKLRLAFLMDKHDTVGIDCVAMCVNDVVCAGARPLFFLDYIAAGKVNPSRIEAIVAGVAEGCVQAGCALIGGETAEMPGFYPEDEYDLAGFAVGMADKARLLSPESARPGDALIALPSSGPHSNGFSLIRRAFRLEENPRVLTEYHDDLGETLGEALLRPTRIYVKPVLALLEAGCIHTLSHITGGGFYENVPRMLPEGVRARIRLSSIEVPPVFARIQQAGGVDEGDMYNTFNMGAGMLLAVPGDRVDEAMRLLRVNGIEASLAGALEAGERGVSLCR